MSRFVVALVTVAVIGLYALTVKAEDNSRPNFVLILCWRPEICRFGMFRVEKIVTRPGNPLWLGSQARNRHIYWRDASEIAEPFLVDLENDIGETINVAKENPRVVKQLPVIAEAARADLGDYNLIGKNVRFFDPQDARPDKPRATWLK